ncbi:17.6 kDa class I heat shock protein-like [Canna indica]|uniref:17.6 kDa class I heat shock protein-like n=1 Tax=Canna indica TaxID=4628 RepID=A0AAQ3JMI4_9LILI|nr:17.6 kDa class I heat shock protein-like [Canna indica]
MEAASDSRTYLECNPRCEWIKVDDMDMLLVDVSGLGFKMEELKVHVNTSRKLTVSGESFVKGDQWRRFAKSFQLPRDCNLQGIRGKFDKEILYVLLPKPPANKEWGLLKALSKHRRLILAIALVIMLVAGLGTLAAFKLL